MRRNLSWYPIVSLVLGLALSLCVPARAQEAEPAVPSEEPSGEEQPQATPVPPPPPNVPADGIMPVPPGVVIDAPETPDITDTIDIPADEPRRKGAGYNALIRPMLWLAFNEHKFWLTGGNTVGLESTLNADEISLQLPLEIQIRTSTQEYRARLLWWSRDGGTGSPLSFGSVNHTAGASAHLGVTVVGGDFLQRVAGNDLTRFEFYLTAGGDLFFTDFELDSADGSQAIDEFVPILTVGMGLRFQLSEGLYLYAASSALSYSQLLRMSETFFDVEDTYQSMEFSLRWDKSDRFSWGVGYKHYVVGFEDNSLSAYHQLSGPSAWLVLRF